MSIKKIGNDETNFSVVIGTDAKFPMQRIVYPNTSSAIYAGQSCVFTYSERQPDPNSVINAISLKYRLENTAANTSTLNIPIWGIWAFIETLKIRVNDTLVKQWDQRTLKHVFMSKIVNFGSIREFLNNRIGTANIPNLTSLTDTRSLVGGTISPYYTSNLNEVFENFFKFRHVTFFDKLEIEFTLINDVSTHLTSKALSVGLTNSDIDSLKFRDLQLVIDISPFHTSSNILTNSFKSEFILSYPYLRNYSVTPNSVSTKIINLNTDFTPVNSIQKIFLWFDNTAISGALTTLNNFSVYVCTYFTQIVVKRNGVQQFILQDSEIYNEVVRWQRNHNIKVFDSFYTSTSYVNNAPTLFINLSKDRSQFALESASSSVQKLTGISNNLENGLWTVEISYDLSTAPAYLDQLNIMLESSQLVCLYGDRRKLPEVRY